MHDPYLDPYGNLGNGRSSLTAERLTDLGRLAIEHDLRLNVLAAGSAAADITVQALQAIDARTPLSRRGWIVQHFQHPTRQHIGELKRMGVGVQTYASIDYSKGAEIYVKRLSGEQWRETVPLRWWLDAGINVSLGSDGAHPNPLFQIWAALQRIDGRTGRSLLTPAKTITRAEAIRLYTINGAKLLGWDKHLGSIESGKLADVVILDANILNCPAEKIREIAVTTTMLAGITVYDSKVA